MTAGSEERRHLTGCATALRVHALSRKTACLMLRWSVLRWRAFTFARPGSKRDTPQTCYWLSHAEMWSGLQAPSTIDPIDCWLYAAQGSCALTQSRRR